MKFRKKYFFKLKVEFEDCDLQGIVHHPNILKYFERARMEGIEEENLKYKDLINENLCLVLTDIKIRYTNPLKFQDNLWITTEVKEIYKNYLIFHQSIDYEKNENDSVDSLCSAKIRACLVNIKTLKAVDENNAIFKKLGYDKLSGNIKDVLIKHPYL